MSGDMGHASGMGGMMWGMSALWLVLIVLAILGVVALTKYIFRQ